MSKTYYDTADLRKFGKITEWSEELGTKFFDYYGKVFEEGALTAREKSLIALAVAHTEQCPVLFYLLRYGPRLKSRGLRIQTKFL